MRTNRFKDLTDSEKLIVSDFICMAFHFADFFDCREDRDMANDEYADFVVEKLTEWENSDYFSLDMPRWDSIELFCEDYKRVWNRKLDWKEEK